MKTDKNYHQNPHSIAFLKLTKRILTHNLNNQGHRGRDDFRFRGLKPSLKSHPHAEIIFKK